MKTEEMWINATVNQRVSGSSPEGGAEASAKAGVFLLLSEIAQANYRNDSSKIFWNLKQHQALVKTGTIFFSEKSLSE
jgi:hypothetical protein